MLASLVAKMLTSTCELPLGANMLTAPLLGDTATCVLANRKGEKPRQTVNMLTGPPGVTATCCVGLMDIVRFD